MSKQSRKKARHRKKKLAKTRLLMSVVCPSCNTVGGGSPAALLSGVADALNACADAGMKIRVRHGALLAREGYVLPYPGDRWTARTLTYDPFIALPLNADEDFDDFS